jgi:hypothetical protein
MPSFERKQLMFGREAVVEDAVQQPLMRKRQPLRRASPGAAVSRLKGREFP